MMCILSVISAIKIFTGKNNMIFNLKRQQHWKTLWIEGKKIENEV